MKKKVLGIIPARGGSKGIPRKNIKKLGNKPLIVYTIEQALKSKKLDYVIVSTDDEEIAEISRKAGAIVPGLREEKYSSDNVPLVPDVIKYVSKKLEIDYPHDVVVLLEPTYPFRNNETIDACIQSAMKKTNEWTVTVTKIKQHPYRSRIINEDGYLAPFFDDQKIFLQRQALPEAYALKGAVYAIDKNSLEHEFILNKKWNPIIIDQKQAIDIDEPIDFILAEVMLNYED